MRQSVVLVSRSFLLIVSLIASTVISANFPIEGSTNFLEMMNSLFSEAPELIEPVDLTRLGPNDPVVIFRWTEIPEVSGYEIEFSFTEEFQELFILQTVLPEFDLGEYLSLDDWIGTSLAMFWRVRAVTGIDNYSDWSEGWFFSKSALLSPQLLTPSKDARFGVGDAMPILSWAGDEGSASYGIEIAEDIDFINSYGWYEYGSTILDCNAAGDINAWNPIVATFYWRVFSIAADGVFSTFSEPFYFSKTTIEKPNLENPQDGEAFAVNSEIPKLTWNHVNEVSTYHLQLVYGDQEFPEGLEYIPLNTLEFDFATNGVTQEIWDNFYGELNWRVAAVDQLGNHGSFSQPFHFVKIGAYRYMAYGDSITGGYGSSTWGSGFAGYPRMLQELLRQRYGDQVNVLCQENRSWFPGAHAYTGDWQASKAMFYHAPSVVLIMFGTVDALDTGAPPCDNGNCHVREHLAGIIQTVRSFHGTPLLATLPPINPNSDRAAVQSGIDRLNDDIRDLATDFGVPVADLESAFFSAPGDLPSYYTGNDWAHFNDSGYQLIANVWNQIL